MDMSNSPALALPVDIAFKIISSLQVRDVCSLGSCSRLCQEVCGFDFVWECLSRERWPHIDLDKAYENLRYRLNKSIRRRKLNKSIHPINKGWRYFYKMKHEDMSRKANRIVAYLQQKVISYESVGIGDYIKAAKVLKEMHFSFKDVQMLFLKPKFSVLVNLAALHYCIMQFNIPAEVAMEALSSCKIEKRKVCIQFKKQWERLGFFAMPHKLHFSSVCLEEFADGRAFAFLQRCVYRNWLEIQISAVAA